MSKPSLLAALVLTGLGLAGLLWSASELAGGVHDLPRHWWSTLAVSPLVLAGPVWLSFAFKRLAGKA